VIAIRYQFIPYLWVSLFLTLSIVTLIIYAWKNRSVLGARYFLLTLTLVEVWILAQALEIAALDLPTKIIWANIQYIPIILTPVTYLYLTLQLTRHEKWLQLRWLKLLFLIAPIAINILLWTNNMHGMIRQNVHLDYSGLFPTVGKTYGPLFWVFAVYNYAINIFTIIILAHAFREKITIYRKQILFLIIALLLPVISNILHITGLNPYNVDTTPSVFGLSAIIISWGIFRYRLFDVIPIARSIIIQEMRTGMIVLDEKGRFLDINPAARKMLNLSSKDLSGHSIESELRDFPDLIRICKEGKDAICEVVFKNNRINYYYEVSFTQIANSNKEFIGWLLQIYNITERKLAEEIIQHAALHDSLTGLPNRNYFQILFSQELDLAKMSKDMLTAAYLDLDDFKTINDTYGHDVGDKVLCEVAGRLKGVLRKSDIISRIGGDEYTIVLPQLGSDKKIMLIGNKILEIFGKSINLNETYLQIRASIGFSVFPRDGDNIDVLLKKADKAMYMAKGHVKSSYYIYKE
jgi:diguanylate cyclase (GGDEF)-like protein/PAS domain S-box-containing protein